jgi:cytochrome c oxidase subunit III
VSAVEHGAGERAGDAGRGPAAHGHAAGHAAARDPDRGRIGMWLFICTEILLFGGLFLLYSVYRFKHHADFHAASLELSRFAGTLNTIVLITSSLTAALSIHELHRGEPGRSRRFLSATIFLGCAFLVVKAFEWGAKFEHGLYPGAAELASRSSGEILYFGLYFMMTGLHALHVIVGMSVFGFASRKIGRGLVTASDPILLENSGLFWHLVDIVWIFLFPLFYLIT